jgi:DNA/RNA-binding protein KIN17
MLGKEGLCKVEDTPKGWFITLIDRDPFEEIEQVTPVHVTRGHLT